MAKNLRWLAHSVMWCSVGFEQTCFLQFIPLRNNSCGKLMRQSATQNAEIHLWNAANRMQIGSEMAEGERCKMITKFGYTLRRFGLLVVLFVGVYGLWQPKRTPLDHNGGGRLHSLEHSRASTKDTKSAHLILQIYLTSTIFRFRRWAFGRFPGRRCSPRCQCGQFLLRTADLPLASTCFSLKCLPTWEQYRVLRSRKYEERCRDLKNVHTQSHFMHRPSFGISTHTRKSEKGIVSFSCSN